MIPPQYVKVYVQGNKDDRADAAAIAEEVSRPGMRFVGHKKVWQQELQFLHRARQRVMRSQIALQNELRGFLYKIGIIFSKGKTAFCKNILLLLEMDNNDLDSNTILIVQEMWSEYLLGETCQKRFEREL